MADPTYEQLPGELDLTFVKGDEVGFIVTLENINLTGYTFDSKVYALQEVPSGQSGIGAGATVAAYGTVVSIKIGRAHV